MTARPRAVEKDRRFNTEFRTILGIRFYVGDLAGLLDLSADAGLIVVPAAPALVDLPTHDAYRTALEKSDLALTDSGLLVLLWLLRKGEKLHRISGLRYLRALLELPEFRRSRATYWIMPTADEARTYRDWLVRRGLPVESDDAYVAPAYPAGDISDAALLAAIEVRRPAFVVINLGGGAQERLGYYLRRNLSFRPSIICTGAAIAFLSGRQADIPVWVDRLMLGWLLRCLDDPQKFLPRYWKALRLVPLFLRHGEQSVSIGHRLP